MKHVNPYDIPVAPGALSTAQLYRRTLSNLATLAGMVATTAGIIVTLFVMLF